MSHASITRIFVVLSRHISDGGFSLLKIWSPKNRVGFHGIRSSKNLSHVSVILCHTSQQSTVKQIFLQMPTIWWVTTLHCEVHLSWAIVHQSCWLSLFNVWDQTTGQFYPGVAISEEASSGQNRISSHMSHTSGLHCSALQWCLECISKEVRLHNAMHCNGKCWVTNTMATVRNASPLICQEAMTE